MSGELTAALEQAWADYHALCAQLPAWQAQRLPTPDAWLAAQQAWEETQAQNVRAVAWWQSQQHGRSP